MLCLLLLPSTQSALGSTLHIWTKAKCQHAVIISPDKRFSASYHALGRVTINILNNALYQHLQPCNLKHFAVGYSPLNDLCLIYVCWSSLAPRTLSIVCKRAVLTSGPCGGAGKVRRECVEGLQRVVGLRRVQWARQVSSLNLLPTSAMLTLLDKKFGGELSKEDVQVTLFALWRPLQ